MQKCRVGLLKIIRTHLPLGNDEWEQVLVEYNKDNNVFTVPYVESGTACLIFCSL